MVCEQARSEPTDRIRWVLILVLMEYGLRETVEEQLRKYPQGLNPCFNGIWSARVKSVKICMWALYDQKNRRTLKFWGKTCTSECKYTKVFWIDCTTCHLHLTILGFLAIFTLEDDAFDWLLCHSSASSSAIFYRLSIPQGRIPVGIIVFWPACRSTKCRRPRETMMLLRCTTPLGCRTYQ